nr:MAG TPA: hypothetical protein [Caudoviricetes sp.]DAH76233.1 MAG TPA: hypothetical protein [Caudoviricetes sp.]DAW50212.1 MAG TPA: hypothetical protein [Caudoviricetes sp.]
MWVYHLKIEHPLTQEGLSLVYTGYRLALLHRHRLADQLSIYQTCL